MKSISTACPRNCYSSCSFNVKVQEGKVVGIEPHPSNQATPEGVCLKGLAYLERSNSPDRLLYPLRKNKERNTFERISWNEAFDEIAAKLRFFKDEFGSHSVLFYAASGMAGMLNAFSTKFWKAFGGATTTYGNLCWPAGLEAVRLTLGSNEHNAPWDLANSKLIVLWGKNAAETNIQQMIPIQQAQEHGALVVVIDPRRTETATKADLHIPINPGTDAALALGIAKYLIGTRQIDQGFIDEHVLGFQAFAQSQETYTLEFVAAETGVPVPVIKYLAELMGNVQPMTIVPGYGMQRFSNGGQTIRCLLALQILTGNIGKSGGNFHYANLQSYVFDEIKEPATYYPNATTDGLFRRSIPTARLGEEMLAQTAPALKMAWVERGNPLTQNPDTNTVKQAFEKLDFCVVVEQFMTDTAQLADIVLPAKNMFEQTDIIGSYWNPYVQLKPKVCEPQGEVKPETDIYYQLAKKLEYDEQLIGEACLQPGDKNAVEYLKEQLNRFPELSWDRLTEEPLLAASHKQIVFQDLQFNTPSGKIELLSESALENWSVAALPSYEPLQEKSSKVYRLMVLSPNTKNRIHSQFGNLKQIEAVAGEMFVYMHPEDAAKRNINSEDKVRIFNERGEIHMKARIDAGIKKSCISIFNGLWHHEGCVNFLSKGRETDMGHGTAFHDNCVELEKL